MRPDGLITPIHRAKKTNWLSQYLLNYSYSILICAHTRINTSPLYDSFCTECSHHQLKKKKIVTLYVFTTLLKEYRETGGKAPYILDVGTRRRWKIDPLDRGLVGPQSLSGTGDEEKSSDPVMNRNLVISPLDSHFTGTSQHSITCMFVHVHTTSRIVCASPTHNRRNLNMASLCSKW